MKRTATQHAAKSCESYFNWKRFCIEAPPRKHLAVCAFSNLETVARDFKCVCMCVRACVWEPPLKLNKDSEAPWFLASHAQSTAGCQSGQPGPLTKSKRVPIGGGDWQRLCCRLNLVGSLSKRNEKKTHSCLMKLLMASTFIGVAAEQSLQNWSSAEAELGRWTR